MENSKTKICKSCNQEKEIIDYYKQPGGKYGVKAVCKICESVKNKANKLKTNERQRKHYAKNKEKIRNWYRPDGKYNIKRKDTDLKTKYGLTFTEFQTLLEKQSYVCAICHNQETMIDYRSKKIKNLAVDHNHTTGKIRGLLCTRCNVVIGSLKEDQTLLLNMIYYLRNN